MIFAPRSWPSRPGFAITTLIFRAMGRIPRVRLTVIGSSPAWPNPGSAHSGYMLEADGSRAPRLRAGRASVACARRRSGRRRCDLRSRTSTSTTGATSSLGSWGTFYSRRTGPVQRPALWVQPGGKEYLPASARLWFPDMFERTFDLAEYAARHAFQTLAVTLTRGSAHYTLQTYAFRVQSNGAVLAVPATRPPRRSSSPPPVTPTYSSARRPCSGATSTASRAGTFLDECVEAYGARARSGCSSRTGRASCGPRGLRARLRRLEIDV